MDNALVQKYHSLFLANKAQYQEMEMYYQGRTQTIRNYKKLANRSNLKVNCNFLKKFIKEECSYSVGNDINYISKSGDEEILKVIDTSFENLSTQHDIELMKTMLKFNKGFELYYIEDDEFKSKIISPLEGFLIKENNVVTGFGREYMIQGLEDELYLDIYTKEDIRHYKVGEDYSQCGDTKPNIFGFIPVGIARVGLEENRPDGICDDGIYDVGIYDTLYNDIKGAQDAYETNISDISNEISDFRNAYLTLVGAELDPEQAGEMQKLGILQAKDANAKFAWLIKDLKDTAIQNNLHELEDKMYQLSQHINHNEKISSNLSGVKRLPSFIEM